MQNYITSPELSCEEILENGYIVIPEFVRSSFLVDFEQTIDQLARLLVQKKRVQPTSPDALIDLLKLGGGFREVLFTQLKYLQVLQTLSAEIGDFLVSSGFLAQMQFSVPLVWPTLRADPPDEDTYLLPMHQDYKSTRSLRALRMWITLRTADDHYGSMALLPGSHKLGALEHDTSDPRYPKIDAGLLKDFEPLSISAPAGSAVIFDPLLVHSSVPNQSSRMKYTALIQIQDHAAMFDPDEMASGYQSLLDATATREQTR